MDKNKINKTNKNKNISVKGTNNIYMNNISMERKQKVIQLENLFKQNNPKKRLVFNGEYTKAFEKFNLEQLKEGNTNVVAFSDKKIFDKTSNRLLNRKNYFTNKGNLRKKFQNNQYGIDMDVFLDVSKYSKPLQRRIARAETKTEDVSIPINFSLLNRDFDNLLKIIKPTTKRYLLHDVEADTFYTLTDDFINNIKKIIKKGLVITEEEDIDSDTRVLRRFTINKNFELIVKNKTGKTKPEGSFFGYNHILDGVDLKRYGVYSTIEELEDDGKYDINCICVALQNAGIDITPIKHIVKNRNIPHKDLKHVADTLGIYITLKYITDEKKKNHYGDRTKPEIRIGNIEKHYFLIEDTNYTRYSIVNYFDVRDKENWNKIYSKEGKKYKRKNDRFIDSYKLIKILVEMKDKYLTPIKYHNNLYKSCFYNEVDDFGSLGYDSEINTQSNPESKMKATEKYSNIFKTLFFDFETTTRRDDEEIVNHKPYCVYTDENPSGFHGEKCGKKLIDELVVLYGVSKDDDKYDDVMKHKYQLRLIAHNCGYDFRFILENLYGVDTIEKGNSIMNGNALCYCGNKVLSINLRDSLKMINMGLGKFAEAFDLEVKKEILPYDLYTEERVEERYIDMKTCLSFVKENDKDEYLKNIKKWRCLLRDKDGNEFVDIIKYSGEYCFMDCITLRDGYNKFHDLVKEATNQDINDYISLASMSNDYLLNAGCYDGVMMLSGVPRHFIQKCVVGGRTMTAQNKKWIKRNCNVSDFDAVSLYPSAMNRMDGFLKGCPKVIENFEPEKYDGYFINIKITKLKTKYNFPCSSVLTDSGIRHFTNDLVGKNIYMDKTGLEDLIRFQGVEYEFIKGYYYDEGRNETIKETMKYLFTQRLKYKKMKNPIQMVFKELMNSSYGKTFMKPIDSDNMYIPKKKLEKYINYHFNSIKEITPCIDGKRYKIKLMKPIDNHFNNVPCGVEILSMSKRIMYEVMTLAEDKKYPVYITDTDSLHIDTKCVPLLADDFMKKYNRELIGKGLGQFHTDFELKGSCGEIIATDCVFLGKKCYVDRLKSVDKNGNTIWGYHTRMKGIPNDCIVHKADTEFGGDIVALYEELYNNPEGLEFNLLACRPKFEYKKNMAIVSKSKFNRRVKFNYEDGEIMYE